MSNVYTPAPDTSTWWVCCVSTCKRECDPERYPDKCPDCGHMKCGDCGSTEHPTPPTRDNLYDAGPYSYTEYIDHPVHFEGDMHDDGYPEYSFGYGNTSIEGPQDGRTPGYAGYWQCCQCSEYINPAFYGTDCTACSHGQCSYCTQH